MNRILVPNYLREALAEVTHERQMGGEFKLVIGSEARGERVAAEFKNLILDSGFARWFAGNRVIGACQLGSGNTPPVAGNTGLQSYSCGFSGAGPAGTVSSYVVGPPTYVQCIINYRAVPGEATGTFAEIGIGWDTIAGANLWSRALIVDGSNNPTTITVLSDEYLDVFYTVRYYPVVTDVIETVNISGVPYTVTTRESDFGSVPTDLAFWLGSGLGNGGVYNVNFQQVYPATSTLGTITGSPSGASLASSGFSFVRTTTDISITGNYGPATTPAGGIACAQVNWGPSKLQQSFSPIIPKTNTQALTLVNKITLTRYP